DVAALQVVKHFAGADRDERLVRALPTLDPWLLAHAADPLVGAGRRIALAAGPGVLPSAREHVRSAAEQAPEEGDLRAGSDRRGRDLSKRRRPHEWPGRIAGRKFSTQ